MLEGLFGSRVWRMDDGKQESYRQAADYGMINDVDYYNGNFT
jgi:hypothetical protein